MISRRAFAYFVLAGAVCASILHLLAMFGYAPFDVRAVVAMLWLVALPAVIATMAHASLRASRLADARAHAADLSAAIPEWGRRLFVAVFIYAGVNFVAFLVANGGGTLRQLADGRYVLSDHGRLVRELDATGVRAFRAWEVRFFSGHFLPFLVLPALYLLFAPALSDVSRPSRDGPMDPEADEMDVRPTARSRSSVRRHPHSRRRSD